jgi:DNA-binding NarL/FixJ family response regulator
MHLMPARILLADDHRIFVQSLRDRIERDPRLKVVAEAGNGAEALRLFIQHKPDISILDVTMPEMNGMETARRMLAHDWSAGIIMLSMHAEDRFVAESLKAGARGYLLKESAFEDLVAAIESVTSGGYYLSPAIGSHVLERFLRSIEQDAERTDDLTPREREVLKLIAEGDPSKTIAMKLGLSTKTIETHRTQIMSRLGIHSIAELTKYAIRIGLTTAD